MSSDDEGTWAPFGPAGDDEPAPTPEPAPPAPVEEPEAEPEPPPVVEEPAPPVAFDPPVAPVAPPVLNWPAATPPAPQPPPVSQWQGTPPPAFGTPRPMASNAVASLVLGIVGLVFCPLIASVAAIVTGGNAKRQIREDPALGGGAQATWGVALGWIGVAWGLLILISVIATSSGST